MFDLVIRNGTIVDGTGRARCIGDVAVRDGLLVQVGGSVLGTGRREIDATGLLVTPGFVDTHTHFDGQITWDDLLEPSASHGVTTIVTGNCGVGFAPVLPERREQLVQLMEGVEDIPGVAMTEGMTWDWVTYPDYLDALDTRSWSMDVGTQITHGALRVWVMGDRAVDDTTPTSAEVDQMAELVAEAVHAGALGFSTSRTFSHRAPDGNFVPGTFATADELWPIAAAASAAGRVVFQLAPSVRRVRTPRRSSRNSIGCGASHWNLESPCHRCSRRSRPIPGSIAKFLMVRLRPAPMAQSLFRRSRRSHKGFCSVF
jgi:N-acyl-D-aspartate/D-glutamate deacylase